MYSGTIRRIIENSGTNQFLGGTMYNSSQIEPQIDQLWSLEAPGTYAPHPKIQVKTSSVISINILQFKI
jgi:hypothetical protein